MHDETPADIWYHDTINAIGKLTGFVTLAIDQLEERGMGQSEEVLMLRKAMSNYPAIKQNLYSEYLEKKRMETNPRTVEIGLTKTVNA